MAKLKYNPLLENNFQEINLGGGGGGGDLQSTLLAGNITGGNSIIFSTGDSIKATAGNFCIDPQFFGTPNLSVISNITITDTVGVFTITGTGGSIDTLTVNGNPLIASPIPFNGNISLTALDLVNQMLGDAGALGITYPRPPRIVSVDFNASTVKILVVLNSTYNTNVLASTTTTLVFAQVQPMTLQNIYDGSFLINSSNNKKYAQVIVNPFESFGYQQEDSDIIRIGAIDSGAPQSFTSIIPSGVFIYNETNITDLTNQINGLLGLGIVSTNVSRIIDNTTGTGLIALCLNSGDPFNPSTINQGVVGSVLLSGVGLNVKTNHVAYTNTISFQKPGNTFDGLLTVQSNTADRTYTLPNRSGNVHIEDPSHVHVYQASDIPAVLVTNTTYIIHGTITTSNTILVANQNTAIIGFNRDNDKLVYTGTGAFINVLDADFFINNLTLTATDPASLVIDARNYTALAFNEGRNKVLHITNSQFRDCYNVCDFEGFDLIDIENTLFWYIKAPTIGVRYLNTSKIEITSCEFIRWFDETTIPTPSGWATTAMFEIQANGAGIGVGAVNISASLFHPQQTQDAVKIDNSSTTSFGTIASNTFIGIGLTTGIIGNFDYNIQNTYIVQANQGLANGNAKGILSLTGNLIELNNSAATGPPYTVVLNSANFIGGAGPTNPITFPLAQRVITSVPNASFTYDSKIDGNFFVNLNATVGISSNGTYTITLQFRQNGIPLPFLGKATIRNSGGVFVGQSISLALQGNATQGDVFDVLVTCDTADDVLLSELLINGYQF